MGLDQAIYRISRPKLENRTFKRDELGDYELCIESEADETVLAVIPYAAKRKVEFEFIDIEKLYKDKNIPSRACLGYCSPEEYKYTWKDGEEFKSVTVKTKEILEKYIKKQIVDAYIWEQEELQYWRKNYDVQDYIYDETDADNCKYCLIRTDIQRELINNYNADFEVEENTEDSGIFYWEWY